MTDVEMSEELRGDFEFVGYRPAAKYLGIAPDTLSSYMGKGLGPESLGKRAVGQYNMWVFTKDQLDRWQAERPGPGARTDRQHSGTGKWCRPCEAICTVEIPE